MLSRIAGAMQQIPEQQYMRARWLMLFGWLLLISLLLYDPISPLLTAAFPNNGWSLHGKHMVESCVMYQAECIERPSVYFLGPPIFWGLIVPSSVLILLVFGHEMWRRICPLSLVSQIPGMLGFRRYLQTSNPKTGKTKRKVPLIDSKSWLGKNYLFFQFGFLFLGLCARLWLIDSNRLGLALWLLLTLLAALAVGILYGGKTWCNYFCPMAPVQRIYSAPGGILTTKASWGKLPQSICRTSTVGKNGLPQEKSACVGCQALCIDLDSERTYWETVSDRREQFIRYGYLGLVIGFFSYYYLCAGNWDYFFSGLWIQQEAHMISLWDPGFFLFGQAIPIPKLFAVPLTLAVSTLLTWQLCIKAESSYRRRKLERGEQVSLKALQHRFFNLTTFLAFNFFFIFAGRSWILLLPPAFQYFYHTVIALVSGIWFYRNWLKTPEQYLRENAAGRLRRQLSKLDTALWSQANINSIDDLKPDELHILAQVLPVLTQTQRHQIYKDLLIQIHQQGQADGALGQLLIQDLSQQLGISNKEHKVIVSKLELSENPGKRRAALMGALAQQAGRETASNCFPFSFPNEPYET